MEKRWIKAATVLRPSLEVCGLRLLPFCLRHRVALEAIDSPVVNKDKLMSARHLVAAARILSTYSIDEVAKPATLRDKFWVSRLRFNQDLLVSETAKLVAYLNTQANWPRFWEKDAGGNKANIPWQLVVVASLVRNGCTLEEAWTMPEAEAIWMHTAHLAALGADVSVVSDIEWEAMQRHKAAIAKNENNPRN